MPDLIARLTPVLKSHFPEVAALCTLVRRRGLRQRLRGLPRDEVFTRFYQWRLWADGESVSGPGSTLVQTEGIRARLPGLMREYGVTSLLDLPCGDFFWMRHLDLGLERYIGADIVEDLVSSNAARFGTSDGRRTFITLDAVRDVPPRADLILCRDCLVHFPFQDCFDAIQNFRASGATYLLTTTFPDTFENVDIVTGEFFKLNLERPPFSFPRPLEMIHEDCPEPGARDKNMALWRLDDLTIEAGP